MISRPSLVSIIVPVYNGDAYIAQNIKKLLDCDYPSFEVLIGNDGSTDQTSTILNQLPSDPRVRIFHFNPTHGAGAVRNQLMAQAQGEYIALQGADDESHPDRLKLQVAHLQKNPHLDGVGSNAALVNLKGIEWGMLNVPAKPQLKDWLQQKSIIHASLLLRKSSLSDCRYHEQLRFGEDYFFLTSLYLNGRKFENSSLPLYRYFIERDDLQTRGYRHFSKILKGKMTIASLFRFPLNLIFIFINLNLLTLSYLRGRLRSPDHKSRLTN